ncbi:uncharacterized protein [Mytilus edulis]|uniref:uncharacterized protein n=1 Tax=Mytilus edulis TaxID=6550 RepID=UPI0039F0272A
MNGTMCVVFAVLVAYVHCGTHYIPAKDCVYNGAIVKDGDQFDRIENCETCHCYKGGISCYGFGQHIVDHRYDCKIVKVDNCWEEAVLASEESTPCPSFSAVPMGRK